MFWGDKNACSIIISELIGSATSRRILRVLFDSGSNRSLIHKQVLPETACVTNNKNINPTTTLGGTVQFNQTVTLEQLHFPDFNKNIKIEQHKMILFDLNCHYDVILGGDFLQKTGININYTECQIEWLDGKLPLINAHEFHK